MTILWWSSGDAVVQRAFIHPPSRVLLQRLLDVGDVTDQSTNSDWAGYAEHLPVEGDSVPINAVVVVLEGGILDGRYHGDGTTIEHPGIQVRVRSRTVEDGWQRIVNIQNTVDEILRTDVTVAGTNYLIQAFTRSTNIISLGVDQETQRFNHIFNGTMTVGVVI